MGARNSQVSGCCFPGAWRAALVGGVGVFGIPGEGARNSQVSGCCFPLAWRAALVWGDMESWGFFFFLYTPAPLGGSKYAPINAKRKKAKSKKRKRRKRTCDTNLAGDGPIIVQPRQVQTMHMDKDPLCAAQVAQMIASMLHQRTKHCSQAWTTNHVCAFHWSQNSQSLEQ